MTLTLPVVVSRPLLDHRARPAGQKVEGAILHSMAEYVRMEGLTRYAPDHLKYQKLSVHSMITPDGTVLACVGVDREAYHAGKSVFGALSGLNGSFLGCEMLVAGDHDYASFLKAIASPDCYTEAQYVSAGWLYGSWITSFDIQRGAVVAHSAVSGDDVRGPGAGKRDPGDGWDWARFWASVDAWQVELAGG